MGEDRLQAERVCCWIKDNPGKFRALCRIVDGELRRGNPRLTRSRAYSRAEDEGIRISDGDGTDSETDITRNHNFWPCITRYMVMLQPRRARTIRFRDSKFDRIDLASVWWGNVNAGTFFLARNRKEAKDLCDLGDASAA